MLTSSQLYLGDQGLLLLHMVHDMIVLLLYIVSTISLLKELPIVSPYFEDYSIFNFSLLICLLSCLLQCARELSPHYITPSSPK